ncbi:hypothetical protein HKX48_006854 [Thoreauomyces humboldtii]|nr:hypothetical protein HKX48_006854 [Thoreauomyces humboldtii]
MQMLNNVSTVRLPVPPLFDLGEPMIPPRTPQGIKRRRGGFEGAMMDKDPFGDISSAPRMRDKPLTSLSWDQLTAAREWSMDRLITHLLINEFPLPEFEAETSYILPPAFHTPNVRRASSQHPTITSLYAGEPVMEVHGCPVPVRFINCVAMVNGGMKARIAAFGGTGSTEEWRWALGESLQPLLDLLRSVPEVLPHEAGEIWKAIVILNKNDSMAIELHGTKVRYPSKAHEDYLR